ncbi:FliH/SctL family protein [Desulfoluna sp.]|uniref:FliH/SctL family protein n=1 Tax=Desulfoluna sp. TaxID=2045199 RepID=UPI0026107A80|nr:FliH/SctL family protein [Desulfoluna sp.]
MAEDGFRPLVNVSSGGFEKKANAGGADRFNRLEFKQEESPEFKQEAPQPEASEASESVETAPEPWADMVYEEAPSAPEEGALVSEPGSPATEETGLAVTDAAPVEPDPGILEVERQAFEMGFEKGEREGFSKGEERAMEMLVRLENLILGFEGAWRRSCENREQQLVSLALVVAEKVALAKADRDDEMAARALVEALAALENPGTCTVRVHPDDFDSVERLRGDLFQRVANLQEITILPDSAVDEGEVRLESDNGWLETDARKRLDEVLSRVGEAAGLSNFGAGEATGGE